MTTLEVLLATGVLTLAALVVTRLAAFACDLLHHAIVTLVCWPFL